MINIGGHSSWRKWKNIEILLYHKYRNLVVAKRRRRKRYIYLLWIDLIQRIYFIVMMMIIIIKNNNNDFYIFSRCLDFLNHHLAAHIAWESSLLMLWQFSRSRHNANWINISQLVEANTAISNFLTPKQTTTEIWFQTFKNLTINLENSSKWAPWYLERLGGVSVPNWDLRARKSIFIDVHTRPHHEDAESTLQWNMLALIQVFGLWEGSGILLRQEREIL